MGERLISERQAAQRLRIAVGTLQNWRWLGKGPAYIKSGKRVLYAESDVLAWQLEQRREPTEPPRLRAQ